MVSMVEKLSLEAAHRAEGRCATCAEEGSSDSADTGWLGRLRNSVARKIGVLPMRLSENRLVEDQGLKLVECTLCLNQFDEDVRRPATLPCGHSFCMACVNSPSSHVTKCPECQKTLSPWYIASTSYAMVRLVSQIRCLCSQLTVQAQVQAQARAQANTHQEYNITIATEDLTKHVDPNYFQSDLETVWKHHIAQSTAQLSAIQKIGWDPFEACQHYNTRTAPPPSHLHARLAADYRGRLAAMARLLRDEQQAVCFC
jgi:hypothetical protein